MRKNMNCEEIQNRKWVTRYIEWEGEKEDVKKKQEKKSHSKLWTG
jgi:hypothetical protein